MSNIILQKNDYFKKNLIVISGFTPFLIRGFLLFSFFKVNFGFILLLVVFSSINCDWCILVPSFVIGDFQFDNF